MSAHPDPDHGRSWIRWWFADRRPGRDALVVGQAPNTAQALIVLAVLARLVVSITPARGTAAAPALELLGAGALAWWSLDELVRGVNPWRRLLGVLGLVALTVLVVIRLRRLA